MLIDMQDVPTLDVSVALALETIVVRAQSDGQRVVIHGLRDPVAQVLRRIDLDRRLGDLGRYRTRMQALGAADAMLRESA